MASQLETDFLVVGAGPAGAALASFLGQNGLKGLVFAEASSTAYTARAHGFNPWALECLRDIDLEDEALRLGLCDDEALTMRIAESFVGDEYGRLQAWCDSPATLARVKDLSPSGYIDLSQRHLEPLLVRYASHHNFPVRFSTKVEHVESLVDDETGKPGGYLCRLHDLITNSRFDVRTKYLFGADGGRSQVVRDIGFPCNKVPGGGQACNVMIRADISHHATALRRAGIHWMVKPDRKVFPGTVAHLRAIRPWNEWMMVAFGPNGSNPFEGHDMDSPELVEYVKELVGDDTIDVEILAIDAWTIREVVASKFCSDDGRAFILGDAAHRHPPNYGLGSNTCIQDAFNLGWKVAFVAKGLAGPGLLQSYTKERQPVGATLVREANIQLRNNNKLWDAMGITAPPAEAERALGELKMPGPAGMARRQAVHDALEEKRQELESLGLAHNHWYTSGAVYVDEETGPRPQIAAGKDPIVETLVTTYPGARLPHCWIDKPERRKKISTLDLAGHGAFCLLIGPGGDPWRAAALEYAKATGVPLRVYGIGYGLDYIDVNREWARKREIRDDGCLLVRPDRFIAWRSFNMQESPAEKLHSVLDRVLSRHEL